MLKLIQNPYLDQEIATLIVLVVYFANDHFAEKPYDLFGIFEKAQPK